MEDTEILKLEVNSLREQLANMQKALKDRGLENVYFGPELKYCGDCETYKPLTAFSKTKATTGRQLQAYCKPCMVTRVTNCIRKRK